MSLRRNITVLLLGLLVAVSGCALWTGSEIAEPSSLPATKMATDTVVLEIAFVRLSGEALAEQEALWRQIDEQQFSPQSRRRINENGLRAGVVNSQLPPQLRQLLSEKADALAVTGPTVDPTTDITASHRKLDSRAGKRGVILAGAQRERMTLLMQQDGQVTGQDFLDAQCLFAVKTFPQGDGRVRMELVPEVEHGQAKQRWIGQEGAFHVESSKSHKVLDGLRMEVLLSPGEVLVLSCTADQKGLGKQFFAESKPGEQKLLMIRLAQTQYDDLFAPESVQKSIVTPTEQ